MVLSFDAIINFLSFYYDLFYFISEFDDQLNTVKLFWFRSHILF